MGVRLLPCSGCARHVRASERSCPFCGIALALSDRIEEFRLISRFDRDRMVALGSVLAAAGIALGCREQVVAVYGAPPRPPPPSESRSTVPPVAPPTAPPSAGVVLAPASALPQPSVAAPVVPEPARPPASARAPVQVPPGAPAAAYGAPPRGLGPELSPEKR